MTIEINSIDTFKDKIKKIPYMVEQKNRWKVLGGKKDELVKEVQYPINRSVKEHRQWMGRNSLRK